MVNSLLFFILLIMKIIQMYTNMLFGTRLKARYNK